jgi:hypothetical protein
MTETKETQTEMESMPVFMCSVCYEWGRPPAVVLQCGHTFHADCMLQWAEAQRARQEQPNCPLCKQDVQPDILPSPPQPQTEWVDVTIHTWTNTSQLVRATRSHVPAYFTFETNRATITQGVTTSGGYASSAPPQHNIRTEIWVHRTNIPTLFQLLVDWIDNNIRDPRTRIQALAPITHRYLNDPAATDDAILRDPAVLEELRAVAAMVARDYAPIRPAAETEREREREREEEYHTDEREFMDSDDETL